MSPGRSSLEGGTAAPSEAQPPGAEPVALGRVAVPKASDVLVTELRRRILDGDLAPGTQLPSERAMVEQTGLSRATVREALRILEVDGLISTRPGRGGGSEVRRSDGREVSHHLDVFIRSNRIRLDALLEARETIEPALAALAAGRRTDAQARNLEAINDRMRDSIDELPRYLEANLDWHLAVAHASGNELLTAFMEAVSRSVHAANAEPAFNSDEVRQTALRAHERVTEAIVAADAEAAYRRMSRHVHGFAGAVLQYSGKGAEVEVGPPAKRRTGSRGTGGGASRRALH